MRSSRLWLARKSGSSKRWLRRQETDPVRRQAVSEAYISRSAIKLLEIDQASRLLRPSHAVLDLGAAPGGWTQVALRKPVHRVVSVDLLDHSLPKTLPGLHWIRGDFTDEATVRAIQDELAAVNRQYFDTVLCDAAPSYTGQQSLDHLRLIALAEEAASLAHRLVSPTKGAFLVKVSRGGEEIRFREAMRKLFGRAEFVKPKASRQESTEIYLLASMP